MQHLTRSYLHSRILDWKLNRGIYLFYFGNKNNLLEDRQSYADLHNTHIQAYQPQSPLYCEHNYSISNTKNTIPGSSQLLNILPFRICYQKFWNSWAGTVAMFAIRFQSVCMYDSNPDILGQYPSTVTTHGDFSQPSTVPPEHQNSFHNQSNTTSISTTYTPYHDEHSPIVRLHLQTVCLPWKLTHPAARTWLLIMLQIPTSCLLPASTNWI